MRKQDHLLGLIGSMDANDKRNFRLMAGQLQEDSSYIRLFDALEGKEHYNATELSQTLGIPLAQLHKVKSYLAKVLLKSLRFYKTTVLQNAHLSNSVAEIEELMARGLYDYALEIADKALAYADEKDYHHLSPAILYLKLDIYILLGRFDEIQAVDEKIKAVRAISSEQQDLHILMGHVSRFQRHHEKTEEFRYHDHPLLHRQPEDIRSKRLLIGWFAMMNSYHVAAQKPPAETLALVRKQVAIYESMPGMKEFSVYQYLNAHSWLATAEYRMNNYQNAWEATDKLFQLTEELRKHLAPARIDNTREFAQIMRICILFDTGKYEESVMMAQDIDPLRLLNDYMRISMAFERAKGLLHLDRSAEAIDALEEMLRMDDELRKEIQPSIRPLLILAQLQLGNHQVVPYLVKSTRSWMKRQKISLPEIDLLLSHAYAIAKAPISKRKDQWKKLQDDVAKGHLNDLNEEIHLGRWLEKYIR